MTSRARADKMIHTGFRWSKFVPEERLQTETIFNSG